MPVLWDKKTQTIVNNESSEIIRIFNTAFNELTGNRLDFYPQDHRTEIDEINQRIYQDVNNGVYRCGFATTQEAYETAFDALFKGLDWLEAKLSTQPYLLGERITEADWRLFTTLVRFDAVYVGHFKCDRQRIQDMPALQAYLSRLFQHNGIKETIDIEHIKRHYYFSHRHLNPTQIVPKGPVLNF